MGKLENLSFSKRKPSIKRIILFLLVAFIVAFGVLVAGFAYIYSITPADSHGTIVDSIRFIVSPGQTAFGEKETMNILCLGIDYNYNEKGILYTKNARSDTIFVLSIDAKADQINMLSIPRDTWVKISDEDGFDKVNAAYAYGGVQKARKVIEDFLGITVDHYIILKVKSTENIVNAIGGIEVDVMKDMDYDDNWGNLHVHLKKGPQVLNGQQAVGYARFRHDEEGDWGRIRRQQQVLNALIRELKKPANIMRMEKIAKVLKDGIETDLSIAQLIDLGRLYKDFDRANMKTGVIKGDDGATADGMSYIVPYEDEKKFLVKKLLMRDSSLPPSDIRIGVLNGSSTEGLATELAKIIEHRGFKVVRISDADRNDYDSTRIICHMKDRKIAESLEEFLGPIEYEENTENPEGADEDFTIIIGNNWKSWKASREEKNSSSPEKSPSSSRRPLRESPDVEEPAPGEAENPEENPEAERINEENLEKPLIEPSANPEPFRKGSTGPPSTGNEPVPSPVQATEEPSGQDSTPHVAPSEEPQKKNKAESPPQQ
ncbi:MAG: LCP family protein [Candidatus Eremiobacteraeota bacterium]|nr:LCP family protein [Candidatus Eremiobacteraeota bacterium]